MLSLGTLSGARIGTISTLGVRHIENAIPDASMPGICRVRVGPGTGVDTKFDVSGDLLVPTFLIDALKGYAYSMQRLGRQALASVANRGRLFLTARGNPYAPQTFNRLIAYFSDRGRLLQADRGHLLQADRGRLLQADRGRRFSAIVDARGMRASEGFNISQSSTISLKRRPRWAEIRKRVPPRYARAQKLQWKWTSDCS